MVIHAIRSLHRRIASTILCCCLTCELVVKIPLCSRDARAEEELMRGELINGEPHVLFELLVRPDNQCLFRGVLCCKCGGIINSVMDEESVLSRHFLMMTILPTWPVNFTRPPINLFASVCSCALLRFVPLRFVMTLIVSCLFLRASVLCHNKILADTPSAFYKFI